METLKQLMTTFSKKGGVGLLPQNLSDELLEKVCEHLVIYHNTTFDKTERVLQEMLEIINPDAGVFYVHVTVFLLQVFVKAESTDELFEYIRIIDREKRYSTVNMIHSLFGHYLLEQFKRCGAVKFEPLPTVNNILTSKKSSKVFIVRKEYINECADLRYYCFREDFNKGQGFKKY
jgi:hypothetical protein